MNLTIETNDRGLLAELFNERVIAEARPILIGEGVAARGLEWRINKAYGFSDVATVVVTVAATIPATVAANLISEWVLKKLKGRVGRVTIEKVEISFEENEIKKIVIEKISEDHDRS